MCHLVRILDGHALPLQCLFECGGDDANSGFRSDGRKRARKLDLKSAEAVIRQSINMHGISHRLAVFEGQVPQSGVYSGRQLYLRVAKSRLGSVNLISSYRSSSYHSSHKCNSQSWCGVSKRLLTKTT